VDINVRHEDSVEFKWKMILHCASVSICVRDYSTPKYSLMLRRCKVKNK